LLNAIVFDIDGTLYRQGPLRRAMLRRLLVAHAGNPVQGWRTFSTLRAYRRAQEDLRRIGVASDIAGAQIDRACMLTRRNHEDVARCVARWMEQEPLAFLAGCIQPGLVRFLDACKGRGLRMGVLSDYPGKEKLRVLGLSEFFDVVLCAQDPAIDCFKPNPRGLLLALERLGSGASEGLYVGDRFDVDVPTAKAAGVRCAIVTRNIAPTANVGPICVATYSELQTAVLG
jgi:FMN phosphatase YigB (HAD superfamily)